MFLQFDHRIEFSFQGNLTYIAHTQTQVQAKFLGKRWARQGAARTWEVLEANYRQGTQGLRQVRFLFKGVRKHVLWLEPYLVKLVLEWFTYPYRSEKKTSWQVKVTRSSRLPF